MFVRVRLDDSDEILYVNLTQATGINEDGKVLYYDATEGGMVYGAYDVVEEDVWKVLKFLEEN